MVPLPIHTWDHLMADFFSDTVNQGFQALGINTPQKPVDKLEQNSPRIQEKAEAMSAVPNPVYRDGKYVAEGEATDGDNPIPRHRLAYNPAGNEDDAGKSFDAWETTKDEDWLKVPRNAKKMAKQRRALAKLYGKDESEVTNEHVFKMGAEATKRLKGFFADDRIDIEGVDKKSAIEGDTRTMGAAYLNAKGEDARTFMNTPEWNANYDSPYNNRGRAENELGSFRTHGDESFSDADVRSSNLVAAANTAQAFGEAAEGVAQGIGEAVVDTVASAVITGESDITPADETTFRNIETKRAKAAEKAQLAMDKNASLQAALKTGVANLYGDPTRDVGLDIENAKDEDTSLEARTDAILRKSLTDKELEFMEGRGVGSTTKVDSITSPRGVSGNTVENTYTKETKDDRYKTLVKRRDAKATANEVLAADPIDLIQGTGPKADKVTGTVKDSKSKVNPVLQEDAKADVAKNKVRADKLFDEGKYVQAAAEWAKGGATYAIKHPGAAFQGAVESVPDMAYYIAAPTLAIATNTHNTYEEGKDSFYEDRGRLPNKDEQKVLLGTSVASALIEKVGAEAALGKVGQEAGKRLTEVLSKKIGLLPALATTIAASATIEGTEEVLTDLIKQVGVNQGKDKLFDSDQLYASFTQGMAAGGHTRATMEAAGMPAKAIKDILSLTGNTAKVAGKGVVAATKALSGDPVKTEAAYNESFKTGLSGAIARVESGSAGYNAYNRGQAGKTGEAKNIEGMTVGEFMAEQSAYEKNNKTGIFAGGKYQIIPETMRLAAKSLGLDPNAPFDAEMQENIFQNYLVKKKRPDMYNYIIGTSDDQGKAQLAMAQEWASVPYSSEGKSYYAGSANNKAHMSDADTKNLLDTARAKYAEGIKSGLDPQVAYSKAMGARTQPKAFSYPSGKGKAGVRVYDQKATAPEIVKAADHVAKATGVDPSVLSTPPIETVEGHDFDAQVSDAGTSTVAAPSQLDKAQVKPRDTQAELAAKVEEITKLPGELFSSKEGVVELTNHVEEAKAAFSRELIELQAIQEAGNDIPEYRLKVFGELEAEIDRMSTGVNELAKQFEDAPVNLDSTGGMGEMITRGSAALAKVDTSSLVGEVGTMLVELQAYDKLLEKTSTDGSKTMASVQGEKLGSRTNGQGKAGMGQHLHNLGAAVAGNHRDNAANAIQGMKVFKDGQQDKIEAIEAAYTEFKADPEGKAVTATFGLKGSFVVKGHETNSVLKHMKKEQGVIDQGIQLGTKLAVAHFNPEAQQKQKKAVHQEVMKQSPSVGPKEVEPEIADAGTEGGGISDASSRTEAQPSKFANLSLEAMRTAGTKYTKEIQKLKSEGKLDEASILERERKALGVEFNRKVAEGRVDPAVTDVEPEGTEVGVPTETAPEVEEKQEPLVKTTEPLNAKAQNALKRIKQIATKADGTVRTTSKAVLGKVHLKALDGVVSTRAIELLSSPVGTEGRVQAIHEVLTALDAVPKGNPTPVIDDSPEVAEVVPASKPSKIETEVQAKSLADQMAELLNTKREAAKPTEAKVGKVLGTLLNWSRKVDHIISRAREGRGAETESTKRLQNLSVMLTSRKADEDVDGIIGKSTDLFTDLREMSEGAFTHEERAAIPAIEQFAFEMSEAIGNVLPDVARKVNGKVKSNSAVQEKLDGSGMAVYRQDANRAPFLDLLDEGGLAPEVLKDAISIAALEWIQANGAGTQYQAPSDIYRFFGMDEKSGGLPPTVLNDMAGIGAHVSPQALSIGKAVLKHLNVAQSKDRDLDGRYELRMAQSIGDLALVAMGNMTTSPTDGSAVEPRGYIERTSLPAAYLNSVSGNKLENANAVATFIKMPLIMGENGLPKYDEANQKYMESRSVEQLKELVRSPGFKGVMGKIVGKNRKEGGVTAVPKKKAPTHITGSTTELSPLLSTYVTALNSQAQVKNPQWELMEAFTDKEQWLRMHGWKKPTINKDGETSFPDLHDTQAISQLGKNMGLEREYAQSMQFVQDWEAGMAEVQAEITSTGALLTLELIQGTDPAVQKMLNKKLHRLENELSGYQNGDIYIEHHVIATGRVNDKGDTLSPQRSKMQRNMLSMKDHVQTIDTGNEDHVKAVIAGLIEPLGLNEKLHAKNFAEEFTAKYMDESGNAADPVVRAGIYALKGGKFDEVAQKEVADAVLALGEGAHSLSALMVLAEWSTAITEGDGTFTTHGYTEVDGTTNGVIASMRQLAGGFNIEDAKAEKGDSHKIQKLLNSGGVILDGQEFKEGIDYLQDNADAYENVGGLAGEKLQELVRELEDVPVNDLRLVVTKAKAELKKIRSKRISTGSRKFGEIMAVEDQVKYLQKNEAVADAIKVVQEAEMRLGTKMFSYTLPNFELANGIVNSKIRKMMKPIVMTGGYQAGDKSLSDSMFNAWLDNTYETAMVAVRTGESADINDVNRTLSIAGVRPITRENAKEAFSAKDTETLRKWFQKSIGGVTTDAYRESMGAEFNQNAKTINAAIGVMGVIVANVQTKALEKAESDKGSALTPDEVMDVKKGLHNKGLFIGFKQYGATGFNDSIALNREEKKVVSPDRGGEVNTTYAPGSIPTRAMKFDGTRLSAGSANHSSVTSNMSEWVPSPDVGVAGMLTGIISIDGMTQAQSLAESKVSRLNVFDANITDFLSAAKEAQTTNKVWEDIHNNWSLWTAVAEQVQNLMQYNADGSMDDQLSEFFSPFNKDPDGIETGNKFAPTYVDGAGETQHFGGVGHFLGYFHEAAIEGNKQRELLNNLTVVSANHRTLGGAYDTGNRTEVDPDAVERGSSDERIDTAEFDAAMRSEATPERVSALFSRYIDNESITDSAVHKGRLQELLVKHILPMVQARPGFGVSVDNGPGTTGGAARGSEIFIRTSNAAIREFSTDMSDAEVLVHEFLHPMIEEGLKDNVKAVQELRELQRQAIESEEFTWQDLVDPQDVDPELAKEKAQRRYDYVTGDLHEFAVFGLSNAGVREALGKVGRTKKQPEGLVEKMIDSVGNLISTLLGKFRGGRPADNPTLASSLDRMVDSFDTTTRTHMAKRVASTVNNRVVTKGLGFLADRVGNPMVAWARTNTINPAAVARGEESISLKQGVTALAKIPVGLFDSGYQAAQLETVKAVTGHKQGFFAKLAREAIGPDLGQQAYHKLLSKVNEHVDSAAIRVTAEIQKKLVDTFSRPLSNREWTMIADTALRTDLKAMDHLTTEEMANLVEDTDALTGSIREEYNKLRSTDKAWIYKQSESLGRMLSHGEPMLENTNMNAFNIATGVGHTTSRGFDPRDEAAIDKLKTLHALRFMSVPNREALADMLRKEPAGMGLSLEIDKVNHQKTLESTYKGDRSKVIAGELRSKSRTRTATAILPTRDHAALAESGYELIRPMGSDLGLYARNDAPSEGYQKGTFSMGNHSVEGTVVSIAERARMQSNGGPILVPIVSGGRITAYRAVMDHKTREVEAGMSIGGAEALGNHGGRTVRLDQGDSYNKQIIDQAYGDYLDRSGSRDTEAFVRISADSPDARIREFARLMPTNLKADIQAQWGGDMFLRKNDLDLLIGYRKLALVDKINGKLVDSGRGEMNAAFTGSVRLAGDVWQGLVGEVKRRTVLFTPAVVLGNFTSNLAVSVIHGMNPVDVLRDQAEGLRAIRAYTGWQDDLAAVELDLSLGKDVNANTGRKRRLMQAMESSGIHPLIQAGLFQSIVEDIDISAPESQGPIASIAGKVLPSELVDNAEDRYLKTPDFIKTGVNTLMLSPSTELGANIQAATAYSDFMARYAMFKHLRAKGSTEGEAINDVMDIYVDYAPNTSREMQYINDMGMYMYTKFLLRIQRVIMRAMAKNTEAVVGFEAAQQLLGNTSDIVDSSLLWGVSFAGGRTQTPDEVFETVSQLPIMHLWSGLKDL